MLLIIEFSFDTPQAIANQADAKPNTALFVLAFLDQRRLTVEQKSSLEKLRMKLSRSRQTQIMIDYLAD